MGILDLKKAMYENKDGELVAIKMELDDDEFIMAKPFLPKEVEHYFSGKNKIEEDEIINEIVKRIEEPRLSRKEFDLLKPKYQEKLTLAILENSGIPKDKIMSKLELNEKETNKE